MGAALAFWHIEQNNERKVSNSDDMQGSYLGPEFSQKEIEKGLEEINGDPKDGDTDKKKNRV